MGHFDGFLNSMKPLDFISHSVFPAMVYAGEGSNVTSDTLGRYKLIFEDWAQAIATQGFNNNRKKEKKKA